MIPKYFIAFFISIALVFSSAPVSAEESGGLLPPKNPDSVQWFEWGENAFELARRDNKPILLYLTSTWCHWVRVMDSETFTDPQIINRINGSFVPVKVDTDLRPDLNARYNVGGWPSTVFLTSEGFVLAGSAYLSPAQMRGVLPEIEKLHQEKSREFNEKSLMEMAEFDTLLDNEIKNSKEEDLTPSSIDKILAALLIAADLEKGGMGKAEKNPIPEVTEFLFLSQEVKPDPKAEKLLEGFLNGQAKLFDPEMGGFYRYAAKRDWTEPQYEKMLGTNAFLIRDYVWGQAVLDRPKDREMVSSTIAYLEENLLDKALGGFFGSQASDFSLITNGLDQKEETAIIPGSVYYGYSKQKRLDLGVPSVDRHVYADVSGQMISALLYESMKLQDEKTGRMALRALDFLMEVSFDSESGMKHVFPAAEKSIPMLIDQVYVLKALLDAYEFSQDEKYMTWMNDLLLITEKNFGTGQGIFFDMASDPSAIANLKKREIPIIENCLMARLYIRLNSSTDKEIFREKAKSILNFFAPRYQQFAFFAASYGSALIDWFYPVIDVTITGKKNDPKAKELFSAVMKLPTNRLHVKWADPVKNEPPKVVMCVGKQCLTPAENADQISIRFEIAQKIVQSRS